MPSTLLKRLYSGEETVKKSSYKRGPRFGPDMIKHQQTTPTSIPVVEKSIQTPVVEEVKHEVVDVVVEANNAVVPVIDEQKEVAVEIVVEKQQETTKSNPERRRR